ncbi:hypothetical protein N0V93_002452 [Gnomoniopsis smithogilvyi]|uniref:Uncharacterized protein n=1 Tax=Gnomoniopsis smithogilvyi TaxID=1191159 RepID=A0A9W8YUT2_9PEZI|nr:hypothetical protein N0V93_002452 [Gnomoniopsis smithogilvyi]
MALKNLVYDRVKYLTEARFNPPEYQVDTNPEYRPESPINMVECIPDPGRNIHRDLSYCPFIYRVTAIEEVNRQHYVILPGVRHVTTEGATGWHRCCFGDEHNDGWYYLEHYLAMEERRELDKPRLGAEDAEKHTAFVIIIRPAFDWATHYLLSPPGYRAYGLYCTMGAGPGPILALDGVHELSGQPGFPYRPNHRKSRPKGQPVNPIEPNRPDYRTLARNAPVLFPAWNRWFNHDYQLIQTYMYNPWSEGPVKQYLSEHGRNHHRIEHRRYMASLLNATTRYPHPPANVPVMAPGQPSNGFNVHAAPFQAPLPGSGGPATQQVPDPQNYIDVHPNTHLEIELNHVQNAGGDTEPALSDDLVSATAHAAVLNDPSIKFIKVRG